MGIELLISDFPKRVKEAYELDVPKIDKSFNRVVVVGMGSCYISGLVLKGVLDVPVDVYDGNVGIIDENTLVILISYSGNTKEIINWFDKVKNHDKLLVVSSGGKLLRLAKGKNVIKITENLHPRFTFCYTFFPVLNALGITSLKRIRNVLKRNKKKIEDEAKIFSKKITNKIPLIYGSSYFYPAVYRLQTTIAEDGKIISHSNKITELFHNELEALPDKRFFPMLILDKAELKNYKKQIDYFKKRIKVFYEFGFNNYSREERMFLFFYFADYLGYYLSKMKKFKMGETPLSDEIKKL